VRRTRERTRGKERRRRKRRRTPLAVKSGHIYIYVSICTHEVTPYMIERSSKDDRAMYDKEIIGR